MMSADGLKHWLGRRSLPVFLLITAMVLCLPALRGGWSADDYIHSAMLNPHHPIKGKGFYQGADQLSRAVTTLFVWFRGDLAGRGIDYGPLPWWTHPEAQQSFFRPISAATHWLDAQLWPSSPAAMHWHSAFWFGALALVVAAAYRDMIGPSWIAGLAALLFAINQEGYQATAWIAARNSVLAVFFVALTVWSYHLHVQRRSWGWGIAALGGLGAGLLSGEAAVASILYLLVYGLIWDKRPWTLRIVSLMPPLVLTVLWRVTYQTLGYGAKFSGLYVDPGEDPLRYLLNLLEWAPWIWLTVSTLPVLDLYASLSPAVKPLAWLAGVLSFAAMALAFLPLLRAERKARFWAIGMVLAVIPACATTVPAGRSTLGVMLGFAPLAVLFAVGVVRMESWVPRHGIGKRGCQLVAVMLFICHLLWPLAGHAKRLGLSAGSSCRPPALVNPALYGPMREMVVVTSPDALALSYVPFLLAGQGMELPSRMRTLTSSFGPVTLTRSASNSVTIVSTEFPLIPAELRRMDNLPVGVLRHPRYHSWLLSTAFRADALGFSAGEHVAIPGMTVTVQRVNERGLPLAVTFVFEYALEDPRYNWVYWDAVQGEYVPFSLPGIGASCLLAGPLAPP